jgi:tetratricopeptide (TPR) repeat protein
MTQHISDAEGVLLDASKRADYDRQLAAQVAAPQHDTAVPGGRDWLTIIREYLSSGNPSAANYAAREATAEQPNLAEAWYLRGTSSALLQNLADAEFELGEAIRLDPNNAAYHAEIGDLYVSVQNWGRAQASYQRASDLEPYNQYYKVGTASMHSAQGRPDLALPILEQAVKDSPDTEFFRYHLAIALADNLTDKWSRFADGTSAILNSAQLDLTKKTLSRIGDLKVNDPDLNQHIGEISRLAADAERIEWSHSKNLAAYGGGALVALICLFMIGSAPLVGILGLAGLVAIPLVYVKRHKVPGYLRDARLATDFVRKTGLQPAPGQS